MKTLLASTAVAAALGLAATQAQQPDTPPPDQDMNAPDTQPGSAEEAVSEADAPASSEQPDEPADRAPMDQDAAAGTATMPPVTPPDGYVSSDSAPTSGNLLGATVHDAGGAEIGTVEGVVFVNGSTRMQGSDDASGDIAAATPDEATDAPAGTAEGLTGTGSETVEAPSATSQPGQSPDRPAETDPADLSHAVIDVGGFLGMGNHRVAIAVEELQIYRSGTESMIYLPWTREQVEALPEFDAEGPAETAP